MRGRPTKSKDDKITILQVPMTKRDKDTIEDILNTNNISSKQKGEYLTASLLSINPAQYIDYSTTISYLQSQIALLDDKYNKEKKYMEQHLKLLESDYQTNRTYLESQIQLLTSDMSSLKKDTISPQIPIRKATPTESLKLFEYENPNGFLRVLYRIYELISTDEPHNQSDVDTRLTVLSNLTDKIDWTQIPEIQLRQTISYLEKSEFEQYPQIKDIRDVLAQSI